MSGISIIVSSYKEKLYEQLVENIENTIGTPYEIIQVQNNNLFGICEAYNKGAEKAKYDYLVFAHEDICFHNIGWGKQLIKTFKSDYRIGLVGVIGSSYKAAILSGWANHGSTHSSNLIAIINDKPFYNKIKNGEIVNKAPVKTYEEILNYDSKQLEFEEVACLDGLFLATKQSIFKEFKFDEKTFKNFHCYDIDYSMQLNEKFKVIVSYNIFITHFSFGSFNKSWIDDSILFNKKWRKHLPFTKTNLSINKIANIEKESFVSLTHIIRKSQYKYYLLLTELFKINLLKEIGFKLYIILCFKILRHSIFFMLKK